jgi:hypothetical protein
MRESATTSLADTRSRPVPIRYQSRQKNNHRIDRRGQHTTAARYKSLYLVTALLTVQAPLAEVLAIVGQ